MIWRLEISISGVVICSLEMEEPWAVKLLSLEQQVKVSQEKLGSGATQAQAVAWQADPKLDLSPKQSPVLVFGPVSHL